MKLSDYAKQQGISYRTAHRMWKRGELKGRQLSTGTILIDTSTLVEGTIVYARVSSAENRSNLESQALRVEQYCIARGYRIVGVVKEVGSGVNDSRQKLIKILERNDYNLIVCEHKDRLTRVGFNYIKVLLNSQGKDVEVINEAREEKEDLMQDFISIITSFCARVYGLRRQKRRTECIIKCLENEQNEAS
ncbi:Resolvase [Hyella patelloides LEGE 07179]|uniref:Resolvase n=1 Tax=Hyella patelloides LEGE 07179 TaxID=945734 RepID=A0A563VN21_9CYAN|nr:IS607 family transposase [Hyella patelloides]VEP12821.1 Resolvase [Hyella patelloides LEGE 07179]